ncbi:MAG: DUF4197 family protein [Chitinophagaceae bacterium]|nr:DUF4197 family protein [Chitinophagaceae bacterium]
MAILVPPIFQGKTTAQLVAAFTPVIKASLDKVNATKYYSDMVNKYNSLPIVFKKINPDLTAYVTGKATNALFDLWPGRKEYPNDFCGQTN